MHRLVQAITLAQLPADRQTAWQQAAAAVIEAAIPADTDPPVPGPSARRCCRMLRPRWPDSDGMARIAVTWARAASTRRRGLQQKIADAREGPRRRRPPYPQRPGRPRPLDREGGGPGGGPRPARRAATGLRAGPRTRAPADPDDRNQLARRTGQAGDAAAARDQFAALQPVCERVLGPEHPQP